MPDAPLPAPLPVDLGSRSAEDPELLALPAPPRHEQRLALTLMVLVALASGWLLWLLRGEVSYAFSPASPIDLGDLNQATPSAEHANRYVRASGLLAATRTIHYERPLEGDSFRLAPLAGNPKIWVEIRVPEGMEGPRFTPPSSFVGRFVPFHEVGIRHRGLAASLTRAGAGSVPEGAWLLIDGGSPRASRWSVALAALLAYFLVWNSIGFFQLVRKIKDATLSMLRLLLVEDDRIILRTLLRFLKDQGYQVETASDGQEALDRLLRGGIDLCLLDMGLPGLDGLGVLQRYHDHLPTDTERAFLIVVSARDDMRSTVEAVRLGAYDYLLKPVDLDRLLLTLRRAAEQRDTSRKLAGFIASENSSQGEMLGRSEAIREVFKSVGAVAATRATVLIVGESGTGKELVARAIHRTSPDADKPFVAVNCGAFARDLLESELFGHVKGAFTGADRDKMGRLELAGKGTLFLDEIGELSLETQVKLLRVLQERTFERVGDPRPLRLEARLLTATHRDLPALVAAGAFREDLYYRLRVVEIRVPPLRERREDIPVLVAGLLARINRSLHTSVRYIRDDAMDLLCRYDWPGNVRELENVLTRACVLAKGDLLTADAFLELAPSPPPASMLPPSSSGELLSLRQVEREHIARVLQATRWNKRKSCNILQITRPTLDRKIREFNLERPRSSEPD
ncbi:MAG: sigma-54 dependent transcriptional regulator [Myxococcales bacterium]|nr:sigma-54 dependent transcriptional regulator [Polyangiaceae bacterium]MDW8248162.1 sigma-54 dependent transcriptional regulator [Myxococcales bacterium]